MQPIDTHTHTHTHTQTQFCLLDELFFFEALVDRFSQLALTGNCFLNRIPLKRAP